MKKNVSIGIVQHDKWLKPYEDAIVGRHESYLRKREQLTQNTEGSLSRFASGYLYFGLQRTSEGWVFREWAPNATAIYLIGDFNGWNDEANVMERHPNNGIYDTFVEGLEEGELVDNWSLQVNGKVVASGTCSSRKLIPTKFRIA